VAYWVSLISGRVRVSLGYINSMRRRRVAKSVFVGSQFWIALGALVIHIALSTSLTSFKEKQSVLKRQKH
jgi:uncharacterized protein YqfA (UPF0365 family)